MRLVFIYGLPATGKLTVAQELAKRTGYKVFHNHLAVDMLLSVFEFGSEPFVELREEIWLSVFEKACGSGVAGLIFTFAPERTVRPGFAQRVVEVVERGGGQVDFVELTCPVEELKRRMGSASRQEFEKLTSVEFFEQLLAEGALDSSGMPKALVSVDTSLCGPAEAAERVAAGLAI
jgi:hypothetical protein